MCAWLLLSAASRDRRHLSSLWEETTSFGGVGKVGGGRSHNRLTLSVHPFKQFIAQTTQRRPAARGGTSPSNVPTTGGWLSFVFWGRSYTPTSMRCFPFFGTGGNSSFRDDHCCAFRNGTDPNENEGFFFLSPLPVVFFNLCGFKRKLHTAEGCGRFSWYLSVVF